MRSDLPRTEQGLGVIARYRERLPVSGDTPEVTLGEGSTPLVRLPALERRLGCEAAYAKLESCNPTGSFKDRGMVVAVAKAMEERAQAVCCASTGNTSASAAAYAARCGLRAYVVVPRGKIAAGKLAQAVAHGAEIVSIDANFDVALALVREACARYPIALVNSVNPYRIEGQKTAAFEIVDLLGDAPDVLAIPVGNAGNITAYWRGFKEYHASGRTSRLPEMRGFQAAGAAPIVLGHPVAEPTTIATAIRIGNPASWAGAAAARDESGGSITAVSDREIVDAYTFLARECGVFCEPASAASVAGILSLAAGGLDLTGRRVVCVITGSGLKDPDTAMSLRPKLHELPPDLDTIAHKLGWTAAGGARGG